MVKLLVTMMIFLFVFVLISMQQHQLQMIDAHKFYFFSICTQILFCFTVYKTINPCFATETQSQVDIIISDVNYSNTSPFMISFSQPSMVNTIHVEGSNDIALCSVLLAIQDIKHPSAGARILSFRMHGMPTSFLL